MNKEHNNKQVNSIINRILKITLFFAIFALVNIAISSYLLPSAHKSTEMWNKFYDKEEADILFVGTSVAEMINANVVESYMGVNCVNMATPSQYFATTRNIIEIATKEKNIDTIVLMMGFDGLERDEDLSATLAVEEAYYDGRSIKEKLIGFIASNVEYSLEGRNISRKDSINKWIFWPVASVRYFDQMKTNWEKKQYYGELYKDMKIDYGNGMSYKRSDMPKARNISDEVLHEAEQISSIEISKDSLRALGQIADYCNINGIRLLVVISPHRSDYAVSFEDDDYVKLDTFTKKYVEGLGCMYVNLNDNSFVRELLTDDYFTDKEHVTEAGVEVASGIMSDILKLLLGV